MPDLTPEEAISHTPAAIELGRAIGQAFREDSPGGKRVTRSERRRIGRLALRLATELLIDVAD